MNSVAMPLHSAHEDLAIPQCASLLELLHPDGKADRSLVFGGNCPASLLPTGCVSTGQVGDLVILAPTILECRDDTWLQDAMQSLARCLAIDGIAYVLAPRHLRLRIAKLLCKHGLVIDTWIAHFPNWVSNRYLVPLRHVPARYAFTKLMPMGSWQRRFSKMSFSFPGTANLLGIVASSVGVVARRPHARPLFNWLFEINGKSQRGGEVLLSTSWRGQDGAVVIHRFLEGQVMPSAVAKAAPTGISEAKHASERSMLVGLGPSAKMAGAEVPQYLNLEKLGARSVLLQTAVSGQSADLVLAAQPSRVLDIMERLGCWLERWNRLTTIRKPLDLEQASGSFTHPLELLAPLLKEGERYRDWLATRCSKSLGVLIPFVSAHKDLTMFNVFLDESRLGIVDWETASEQDFPLADFFYAVTDAVMVAKQNADRPQAFDACFAPGGDYVDLVVRILRRLVHAIEIPADAIDLCFHACWLHHAVNEHYVSKPSDPRPFLEIVQRLAWRQRCIGWMTAL